MYLADYHTHCLCSPDGRYSMADMAVRAAELGVRELCFTDHVDTVIWSKTAVHFTPRTEFDWQPLTEQFAAATAALGDRILLRLGAELGEVTQNRALMETFLSTAPPLDFLIGSVHTASADEGWGDLYTIDAPDAARWQAICGGYFREVLSLCQWGRFDVLGHLTLPARYAWDRYGLTLEFAPHRDIIVEIFRTLIDKGLGIEVNTNRGATPLPDEGWLKLYRSLGGERVSIGSDAHSLRYVGCGIAQAQQLLAACGFRYFNTFSQRQAVFHPLED